MLPWLGLGVSLALSPEVFRPTPGRFLLLVCGYVLTHIGLEVGFHRLFTHRAFHAHPSLRAVLLILGSTAAVGPIFGFSAMHRRHHQYSERAGDPHSPWGAGPGFLGRLRGLWYAHVGWLWNYQMEMEEYRAVSDLMSDPVLYQLGRMHLYPFWVVLGFLIPTFIGGSLWGFWPGALQGFLWGGAMRILLAQNAAFSINSLGHFFGRQPFETGDESRDNLWLVLPTLGAGWQNTHHAFPASYSNRLDGRRLDPSAWVILLLERLGMANDLRFPSAQEILAKKRESLAS